MLGYRSEPSATPSRVLALLGYLVLTVPHSELEYPLIPSPFHQFFCTVITGNTIRHPLHLYFVAYSLPYVVIDIDSVNNKTHTDPIKKAVILGQNGVKKILFTVLYMGE